MHGVHDAALKHGAEAEVLMVRLGLDRAANAPLLAAEAAKRNDHPALVQALLVAARESIRCGDLFPGAKLAAHAGNIARLHRLDALAAETDALAAELAGRLVLPDPES